MTQSNSESSDVAIVKEDTPKECILSGIEQLGGISKFINPGESVFIKFNLCLPQGFPTNTNLEVIERVIELCYQGGAEKVYVGSFPHKGFTIKSLSDVLELKTYFERIGAEFVFLDNSNYYIQKDINSKQLKSIKMRLFSKIDINGKTILLPKIFLESDKIININQVNVDPLFQLRLSLQNNYSIIPNRYQEIGLFLKKGNEFLRNNLYIKDLVESIIDVYSIKKSTLVINDLFYILEGAGPFIYKDSHLKKTGLMVIGNDAIAVDSMTVRLLNLNPNDFDIIKFGAEKKLGLSENSKINLIGKKLNENQINIIPCVSHLEDLNVQNLLIKPGKYCSGCYRQAYYLLNMMKTYLNKDLTYIGPYNSFLIGENPLDPENLEKDNIILFGNCAINSTKKSGFKLIKTESKKKYKVKINKKILRLPGCPPDIYNCLNKISTYYGKKNAPSLNLLNLINLNCVDLKNKEKLKVWERA